MKPTVFLDSSAIIAAIFSSAGGARALLQLGEFGFVALWVSRDVLAEVERDVAKVDSLSVAQLAMLLDAARVNVAPPPSALLAQKLNRNVRYAPDAVVLAAAQECGAAYFVTLDREHILKNPALPKAISFEVGTPGDCLNWLRSRLDGTFA